MPPRQRRTTLLARSTALEPLWEAVERQDLGEVRSALAALPAGPGRAKLLDEAFVLPYAAGGPSVEIVRELLAAGADVDLVAPEGMTAMVGEATPLVHAAAMGELAIVEALLGAGAAVNKRVRGQGVSALVSAMKSNEVEVARALLRAGATARRDSGILVWAAEHDCPELTSELIAAGADIEGVYTDVTPLMKAAGCDHLGVMRVLIDAGAKLDRNTGAGTALNAAAMRTGEQGAGQRKPDAVEILLSAGADPTLADYVCGERPLEVAAREGNLDVARVLIQRGPPGLVNMCRPAKHGGASPLLRACGDRDRPADPAMVGLLLEAGANPNQATRSGETPLMGAASVGRCPEVVRILIEAGADVNAKHSRGSGAITFAASAGQAEVLRLLLAAGADANDSGGVNVFTPLSAACDLGLLDCVEVLLQGGADPNQENGCPPLVLAASSGNLSCVKALLEAGADPRLTAARHCKHIASIRLGDPVPDSMACRCHYTALMHAVVNGNVDMVRVLLDHPLSRETVDMPNIKNSTCLMIAAQDTSPAGAEIARLLIKAGANVHLVGAGKLTALGTAACSNNLPVLKRLIRMRGRELVSEMSHTDSRGLTPLHIAVINGHDEAFALMMGAMQEAFSSQDEQQQEAGAEGAGSEAGSARPPAAAAEPAGPEGPPAARTGNGAAAGRQGGAGRNAGVRLPVPLEMVPLVELYGAELVAKGQELMRKALAAPERKRCGACLKDLPGSSGKACGACQKVHYCSKGCQRQHWPQHKLECAPQQQGAQQQGAGGAPASSSAKAVAASGAAAGEAAEGSSCKGEGVGGSSSSSRQEGGEAGPSGQPVVRSAEDAGRAAADAKACGGCHKALPADHKLRCGRCKEEWYCNPECQAAHWKVHKRVCGSGA